MAIKFTGSERADIRFHDGALRHAAGAAHYQILRANREHPELSDGFGYTYNHAPMICYWNGHLFVEYLCDAVSEHTPPSHTALSRSRDGADWTKPTVIFPGLPLPAGVYTGPNSALLKPGDTAIMHQRMGFYVSPDDHLYVLAFYGVSPEVHTNPNNGYGIARVVREVYRDFTFSPVYVIKYGKFGGFAEADVPFPFYESSGDSTFVKNCAELLANTLLTAGWWEEDRLDTEFFKQPFGQAFCYYRLSENEVVGLCKRALIAESSDNGATFGEFTRNPSIETSTGKVWGEKNAAGQYALVYNPTTDSMHRWPLAVVTSQDGREFRDMLTLTTQVPPLRYTGWAKNLGPQYIRGILQDYPRPDGRMWLTYSMNKEDIWVCGVTLPITGDEENALIDLKRDAKNKLDRWNIYSPLWAKVAYSAEAGGLVMRDSDPYDRAVAERVLKKARVLELELSVKPEAVAEAGFFADLTDDRGVCAVRFCFRKDRALYVKTNGVYVKALDYAPGAVYTVRVEADCERHGFTLSLADEDGAELWRRKCEMNGAVAYLSRLTLQTKIDLLEYGLEHDGKEDTLPDLPGAGERLEETRFVVTAVSARSVEAYTATQ